MGIDTAKAKGLKVYCDAAKNVCNSFAGTELVESHLATMALLHCAAWLQMTKAKTIKELKEIPLKVRYMIISATEEAKGLMGFAVPRSNRQTSGVGDYELTDTARNIGSLLRFGTIHSVNYEARLCRVQLNNDVVTDEIPWITITAGGSVFWNAPSVEETVLLLSPSGELNNSVCLPALQMNPKAPGPSSSPIWNLSGAALGRHGLRCGVGCLLMARFSKTTRSSISSA